jgi:hypothetical protein
MRSNPPGVLMIRNRADSDSTVNVCGIPSGKCTNPPTLPRMSVSPQWNMTSQLGSQNHSDSLAWTCRGGSSPG